MKAAVRLAIMLVGLPLYGRQRQPYTVSVDVVLHRVQVRVDAPHLPKVGVRTRRGYLARKAVEAQP
jgi:hypothetical protein